MWWLLHAVVAHADVVLAAAGLWLTVLYGQRTCALLQGLVRRDNRK
jgi:hypothetical protein